MKRPRLPGRATRAFVLVLAAVLAAPPPGLHGGRRAPDARRPNIVIVCINCLARSHVGVYGGPAENMPRVDEFARRSYVFTNLAAPATGTPPVMYEFTTARLCVTNRPLGAVQWPTTAEQDFRGTAIGRYFERLGYNLLKDPDFTREPFVSLTHHTYAHSPYDPALEHRDRFEGARRAAYEGAVERLSRYGLVREEKDRPTPSPLCQSAFRRDVNTLTSDSEFWRWLQAPNPAGVRDAVFDEIFGPVLSRELMGRLFTGRELSWSDKTAVVKALNALVSNPRGPLAGVLRRMKLEDPRTFSLSGASYYMEWSAAALVSRIWRRPWDVDRELATARSPFESARLAVLYRDLLETLFPPLAKDLRAGPTYSNNPATIAAWAAEPQAADELEVLKSLYDANLTTLDGFFGKVLTQIDEAGAAGRTAVVFMGDHGEAFMEHGGFGHGYARCYDMLMNPALVIRLPDGPSATVVVPTQLRMADIVPTLLDMLKLPPVAARDGEIDGVSVMPRRGAPPEVQAFCGDAVNGLSVRTPDGWKLLWDLRNDGKMLFNLREDPGEERNVLLDHPDRAAKMQEALQEIVLKKSLEKKAPAPR